MRIGPLIFLLLGLALLSSGLWFLYVRFVAGPEPNRSAEDEQLLADMRKSLADLQERHDKAEAQLEQRRVEIEKVPKDDPAGKRAQLDALYAEADAHRRKSAEQL